MMLQLVGLYFWAILAGTLAAPGLAILGVQLATRDRAMQILCVGQGAMLGVLLGIGIFHGLEGTFWMTVAPFVTAMLVSSATYLFTETIVGEKVASKNTTFAFIFGLLMAVSHLVSAIFPGLESHMSQVYFGDLATLSVLDSQLMFVVSGLVLVGLILSTKAISRNSFEQAVFGKVLAADGVRTELAFKAVTLVILCFSVQFVGFLFTIAMLFIPTAIMSQLVSRGLRLHLVLCSGLAIASTLAGFLMSLWQSWLPTVPTIVFILFLVGVVVLLGERVFVRTPSQARVRRFSFLKGGA